MQAALFQKKKKKQIRTAIKLENPLSYTGDFIAKAVRNSKSICGITLFEYDCYCCCAAVT